MDPLLGLSLTGAVRVGVGGGLVKAEATPEQPHGKQTHTDQALHGGGVPIAARGLISASKTQNTSV